jgi:hypothetical protein
MISYCAHACTLVWQTMLTKGVFIFFAKKSIFYFVSVKTRYFCEAAAKILLQTYATPIYKNTRPHFKAFWEFLIIYTVFCRFSKKGAKFEQHVIFSLFLIFLKSFLYPQGIILLEIWCQFRRIPYGGPWSGRFGIFSFHVRPNLSIISVKKLEKWKTFTYCGFMWPSFEENNLLGIWQLFWKSLLSNELPRLKMGGF